jgi:flagellar motor switch protein FliG
MAHAPNRRQGGELPKHAAELDGVTKAAVLLVTLSREAAEALLRQMPRRVVEDVTHALAQLGPVPNGLAEEVMTEFFSEKLVAQRGREGGVEVATELLKGALEPRDAEDVIQRIESRVRKTPFAFLQRASSENLLTFIQDEHPQTIALIVSHLPHPQASEILKALPPQSQIEVVRRMAHMEQTDPDVIREVESSLASRLSSMLTPALERVGGLQTVAEVLNLCDRGTEKTVLEGLESDDPELVEQIRRLMFVFEDILMVDAKGIQTVLKEVDNDELCLALKTASEELKAKIFANMSTRASDLIREEMEYMGPVRLSDVEAAQQRIVDIVRRLEDAGEIIIAGRGGEKDAVV